MATVALEQLTAPYDLASEGPQLATIGVIRSGLNPYSPEVFNDYPFVLTFYTPLYYYVVNALAGKSDLVFTARATSLVCMIAAGCIPLLVARQRLPILGILATSVFFLFWPVTINAEFAKNDSMAILFGALAVWSAWRFPSSGGTIVSAALGLVSFMAKQSFVTALISIAIYLAITDRRRLVIFLNATVGLAQSRQCYAPLSLALDFGLRCWHSGFIPSRLPRSQETSALSSSNPLLWSGWLLRWQSWE
jgi:hypothetical protein